MSATELLDQLDALHAAGTSGEWHVAGTGGIDAGDYDTVIGRGDVDCMSHCYGGTSTLEGDNLAPDSALIVAAVNALPQLTGALRAVLDLHVPDQDVEACSSCWTTLDQAGTCPTVRAITAALGPAQPQSGDRP